MAQAQMHRRVCSMDLGREVTGIVVVDIGPDTFDIVLMRSIKDTTTDHSILFGFLNEEIKDLMISHDSPFLVYENTAFNFTQNHRLTRLQGKVRKYFNDNLRIKSRALKPKQKYGVTASRSEDRKKQAVEVATGLLQGTDWLSVFQELSRAHDVADALLMAKYMEIHPELFNKKK